MFFDKVKECFFTMPIDLLHLLILLFTCILESSLEFKTNPKGFRLFVDWVP